MSFFYPGWTYIRPVEAAENCGEFKYDPAHGCTCGAVKACEPNPPTGHSSWCDINNPPPETEELPF